jgi:hypothetical protein
MTARQATHAAVTALSTARTARVRGTIKSDGKPLSLDMYLSGAGFRGTFTVQGAPFQIIVMVSGRDFYMKGPAKAWKVAGTPDSIASLVANRWVKAPADSLEDMPSLTLKGFTEDMMHAVPESQVVALASLDSRDVALVTYSDGSMLYVSRSGPPYPLRYVMAGADGGRMDFSEFGSAVRIAPPPGAIDMSNLG